MKRADLSVEKRDQYGKSKSRQLRIKGLIPAVLYGKGIQPIPLKVKYQDLVALLHGQEGHNMILNMRFTDGIDTEILSIPKDIQFDPIHGKIIHVDFLQIRLDKSIHTQIPVRLVGSSVGVRVGSSVGFSVGGVGTSTGFRVGEVGTSVGARVGC